MSEYKRPNRAPDIEVQVTLLSSEAGGRIGPVSSGYRPNHDFGIEGSTNDAVHEYPGVERLRPGECARALLWLAFPEAQHGRLYSGFEFTVQEGGRVVGKGKIIQVLNQSLQRVV